MKFLLSSPVPLNGWAGGKYAADDILFTASLYYIQNPLDQEDSDVLKTTSNQIRLLSISKMAMEIQGLFWLSFGIGSIL
jgi:hypothetical protein